MEFDATQIYEDDDFSPTQRISHTSEEEEPIQVGTLSINSNEYQIKRGTTKIGRHNSCDIVINDVTVSKMHAEIEAMRNQGSRIWICDLNSSNKTRLDDEILLPTRLYEVKDGSIIKFGRVHATYRAYRSTVIPETPAPSRQRVTGTIIPSTPDSSLNSSGDDGSVILGTQRDEQNSVFRRPLVPRQSTSIGKKNISHTSFSESDDLQTATVLHASNISENQEPSSIFDMETQKLEGHETVALNSIHDIETQMFPTDASIHQANTKTNKQLQSKLKVQDEVASTSATNIYDMETQHYASSINELETQKSKDNIRNVTSKKFTTDIHNAQTQNYIDGTDKDTDKNNEKKGLDQVECNINDLETQKLDNKDIAEDISNVETQPELNGIRNTTRNICDVETQLEMDGSVNDVNDDRDYTDKDITKTTKNGTNDNEKDKDNMTETKINYNVTHSPNSRSSSPGSLNLSSPGVDEDCLSSLQHSDHLLESSDLLEYFGEGIDKREEIRASRNTSTPKSQSKTLSERDNAENISSVSNNDEDNIFDAPTQRSIREFEERSDEINEKDVSLIRKLPKKKRESKESIDDDPEMDTEEHSKKLTKKQRKSSEISDKSCNDSVDNRNDPATSVESEDIFDALTQQSNSPAVKDTSNSSINQLSKINETDAVVDDMAPTQIINNDENTHDQGNLTNTHKLLTDINSINSAIEDGQKKHIGRKKTEESFQAIANDSLEQKLNEMFDNVNSNSIDDEPPHISTQTLEDILESSQCDNDLSANKSTVNESSPTDNVSQTQLGKKSRAPCDQWHDPADTEANNVNKVEIDSQNYFSTPTTRQKRNILKETQELVDSMQIVIPSRQDSNTSQISKVDNEKVDDNTATEFNKREKKISNSRNESQAMADTSNDDNVTETISNGNNERNLRRSMKRKDGTASEKGKRILRRDPGKVKIDDVEKDSVSESNVCAPCLSKDAERMQTSDTCESDDDILTRLPAVRISGTLSNPVSPSASSTSTVHSDRSKRGIVKGKNKKIVSSRNKSLREQAVEDSEKDESPNRIRDKPSVSLLDNNMPSFDPLKIDKMTRNLVDTSEDSDSETNYKRFKQMADRMLNNELDLKRQSKRNVQNKKSDKKKSARSSPNLSNDLKRDTDDELKSSSQTSSRVTRHSSRQNDKSSDVSRKEAYMENATYDKSTKPEARSIVPGRKRALNTIEKDVEQTNSRKRKACQVEERPALTRARRITMKITIDRQSPNIVDYFISSRSNSPVIGNTKSSRSNKTVPETVLEESQKTLNLKTDENIDSGRSYIKRTKRKINDDQAAMCADDVTANESSNSNKQVQAQESKTEVNLSQDKVLKIVLSPIKSPIINPIEDESQEVEMIMGKSPSNVQDKNLSIRETNTAKIFQRRSRIRSRKQLNADTKTDSILIESSTSSSISDSNNTQSDDSTSTTKTRRRFTRSSAAGTQASKKKETFKKPTRFNQNSASSVFDSSTENITSESSQNSMENDTLSSSRSSRSKVAGVRKKEKIEVNQSMRRMVNDSASRINTSIEIASPPSTPSTRMRRSASVLSNSTLSAARHKILFTGITEDYSKIIKTLGGIKVEDPAKCSVLVTDKVRRTYKFLCALAKGVPIVAIDWLRDSESAARFLDWEGYILKDPAAEAKFGFRLRKSLDKAKEKRLLDGYTILLTSNVAPPPIEELKDMVTSCGGKALLRPPNKWPEKAVIISREEDLPNAKKFLMKAPKTVTIQSTEFILTGILRQETDFVKYRIT